MTKNLRKNEKNDKFNEKMKKNEIFTVFDKK